MSYSSVDYFEKFVEDIKNGKNFCHYNEVYVEIKEFFEGEKNFLTYYKELFSSPVINYFFCENICPYLDHIKKLYKEIQKIDQTLYLKYTNEILCEISFCIDVDFNIQFNSVEIVFLDSIDEYIFSIAYDSKEFISTVKIVEKDTKLCRKTILNFETKLPADLFLKIDLLLNQEFFNSIGGDSIIKETTLDFLTYEKYRDLIIIDEC